MKKNLINVVTSCLIVSALVFLFPTKVQAMYIEQENDVNLSTDNSSNNIAITTPTTPDILSGWITKGNSNYYYVNNEKLIGKQIINNEEYYFNINGELQKKWINTPDGWIYANNKGVIQKGLTSINNNWYYLSPVMQVGKINIHNSWIYANNIGILQIGWVNNTNNWYYFNDKFEIQTGWLTIDNDKYYLDPTGKRQTGWIEFDMGWCYFYEDGKMARDTYINNKYVDKDGYYNERSLETPRPSANDVINEAYRHLGKSYQYGSAGPNYFDCSGFTMYVYKKSTGIDIGRDTGSQINAGVEILQKDLRPGDLVFPHSGHVGIYLGNGRMIHSPSTGDVVKIAPVYKFWRARRILN